MRSAMKGYEEKKGAMKDQEENKGYEKCCEKCRRATRSTLTNQLIVGAARNVQ